MADNTTLSSGSGGDTIATDDIGSVKYPRSKIVIGADGVNDGDVSSANPLPISGTVDLGATDNAVLDSIVSALGGTLTVDGSGVTQPVSGTVTANLSATDNAVLDSIAASVAGSLTVDAANDGSLNVTIGDGTSTATVRNLASNDALNVSIVDGAGNQVTSFGGSGGTSATDDAAFTAGSGSGTPVMGYFSTDTVDAGDVGVLAMDASRRLLVSIETDNAGIGGGTQYTADAVAPATPTGNALLAERDDALGGLTAIEGDWSQLFCDANGALWTAVNGTVTVDGSGVTQPVSGTVTANLGATDNAVLDSIDAQTASMDTNLGTVAAAVSGSEMQVDVVASLPAGTNAIGKLAANSGVDIGDVDVTSIAAGSNLIGDVGIQGRTTGGLSTYYDNDLDETAVAVKASAGTLYSLHVINTTADPLYLQFFNVAQGSVTVGTTTPTMQFVVPGNADSDGAGFTLSVPQGIAFSTAITAACSTNSEGNTAPGANACHVNLFYK